MELFVLILGMGLLSSVWAIFEAHKQVFEAERKLAVCRTSSPILSTLSTEEGVVAGKKYRIIEPESELLNHIVSMAWWEGKLNGEEMGDLHRIEITRKGVEATFVDHEQTKAARRALAPRPPTKVDRCLKPGLNFNQFMLATHEYEPRYMLSPQDYDYWER